MDLVATKPVFGVSDQAMLKPDPSITETSKKIEIKLKESSDMILSKKRITKALISLRGCAGWFAPLLFANLKDRFSHVVAHIIMLVIPIIMNFCACLSLNYLFSNWSIRERSGSVIECLTRDRRVAGLSFTGVTALCPWARTLILA